MGAMGSQITSLTIVHSTVYSGADQRKHQSSASLAFVRGIHRSPVNSLHKWPVTRKMFPFDDVIMTDDSIPRYVASSGAVVWIIQINYSYLTSSASFLECHSQSNQCYCFETLQWYFIFIESNPMTVKLATRVHQSEWWICRKWPPFAARNRGGSLPKCHTHFLKFLKTLQFFIKNPSMLAANYLFRIYRKQFRYCLTLDLQQTIMFQRFTRQRWETGRLLCLTLGFWLCKLVKSFEVT